MKKRFFAGLLCLVMLTSMLAGLTVAAEDYTKIDLSSTKETAITVSGTTQLWVNGADASTLTGITYTSSNEEFATVSSTGLVTGVKAGIATITATAGELSDSLLIVVSDSAVKNVTLSSGRYSAGYVADDSVLTRKIAETEGENISTLKVLKSNNLASYMNLSPYGSTVSFWLYDTGSNDGNFIYFEGTKDNQTAQTGYTGIYPTWPSAKAALYFDIRSKGDVVSTRYNNASDGGFYACETGSAETEAGWHQVVYRLTEESLKIYYDGKPVFEGEGRRKILYDGLTPNIGTKAIPMNISDLQLSNTGNTEIDVENGTSALKRDVTFNVGENGSLGYWKSAIEDGTTLSFSEGYPLSLKATPAEGYELDSFKVGGAETPVDEDGYVSLTINNDTTIDVTFREKVESPLVNTYGDTHITPGYYKNEGVDYPSFVSYYRTVVPAGTAIAECGMKIKVGTGEYLPLAAKSVATDGVNAAVYAIRVWGEDVITNGGTYTVQGYLTAGGQEYTSTEESYTLELE